ncbi:MAG: glycosyltransferase family 4 protein [Bacteroidetes bacterium]|nr:glycosyltransferase family 4 protein [Bacteroidota bacterium]
MPAPSIAVNTRLLLPGKLEGIGRFGWEVLQLLVKDHPQVQFHFLFDRPWDPQFIPGPNVTPHVLYPQARPPLPYWMFFEWAVPYALRRIKPAVFFSPDGYLSLSARIPQVPVMHDIAYMHYPEYVDRAHRWHYHRYFPRYARKAAHILTVSEYSRQDIAHTFNVPADKITVCHNGSARVFHPLPEPARQEVRQQYAQGHPYFLYVGSIHPRKNLENVLRAYELFREQVDQPHRLVLTGRKAWDFENVIRFYGQMRFRDEVIFTGFVPDAELNRLLNGALALSYVSVFEGFGLPLLEAMHAETAVITSNTSSMPEVAADAALRVSPAEPQAIARAMVQVATQPLLRDSLIQKGILRREVYSWQRTAAICWEVLDRYMQTS